MSSSPGCGPNVARVAAVITQEEEEEDNEDDVCEIVENEKETENDDGSPVCVQVSQLKPEVRKLLSMSGHGGRTEIGNCTRFVVDPLSTTNRSCLLYTSDAADE